MLLGAPAAGLLVGAVGPLPALAVTASVFAAAAVLAVLTLRGATVHPAPDAAPAEPSAGYWRDLGAGLRFCVRDPLFRLVIALVLVTNLLDAARSTALLPLYADRVLDGAQSLGIVSGTYGGAAFLGSLAFGYVAHRLPRRITFVVCFVLAGGPSLVVPALGLGLPWMLGACAVSGLAAGALNPILGAVELERIPGPMRAGCSGCSPRGRGRASPSAGSSAGSRRTASALRRRSVSWRWSTRWSRCRRCSGGRGG